MRSCLVILSLLALCLPAFCALPSSNGFSQPVTLDARGEAVSDVVNRLAGQTGAPIAVSAEVANQKITIMVDGKPLGELLNGIAAIFGWEWAEQNGYYVLYDAVAEKREADRKAALAKAWEDLGRQLDELAMDPDNAPTLVSKIYDEGFHFYDSYHIPPALVLWRSLTPNQRAAFLSGKRLTFDMASDSEWKLNSDVIRAYEEARVRWFVALDRAVPTDAVTRCTIEIWTTVGKGVIEANIDIMSSVGGSAYAVFCCQEIGYSAEEYVDTIPHSSVDGLLENVSISTSDVVAEGAFTDAKDICSANRTDLLAVLHRKTGMQIISDHYSSWGKFGGVQNITIQQVLDSQLPGFAATWGCDGNTIYMRVKDSRSADIKETPNWLLKPWQAVVAEQGYRGFEELSQAALLSDEQRQGITENHTFLKLGECREITRIYIKEVNAILRFYGLLSTKQKKDLFVDGVEVSTMTQEQKAALGPWLNRHLFMKEPGAANTDLTGAEGQLLYQGYPVTKIHMSNDLGNYVYYSDPETRNAHGGYSGELREKTAEAALKEAQGMFKDAKPENIILEDKVQYLVTINYQTPESLGGVVSTGSWFSLWKSGNQN